MIAIRILPLGDRKLLRHIVRIPPNNYPLFTTDNQLITYMKYSKTNVWVKCGAKTSHRKSERKKFEPPLFALVSNIKTHELLNSEFRRIFIITSVLQ